MCMEWGTFSAVSEATAVLGADALAVPESGSDFTFAADSAFVDAAADPAEADAVEGMASADDMRLTKGQ